MIRTLTNGNLTITSKKILHVIIIPGGSIGYFCSGEWIYTFRGFAQGGKNSRSGMGKVEPYLERFSIKSICVFSFFKTLYICPVPASPILHIVLLAFYTKNLSWEVGREMRLEKWMRLLAFSIFLWQDSRVMNVSFFLLFFLSKSKIDKVRVFAGG